MTPETDEHASVQPDHIESSIEFLRETTTSAQFTTEKSHYTAICLAIENVVRRCKLQSTTHLPSIERTALPPYIDYLRDVIGVLDLVQVNSPLIYDRFVTIHPVKIDDKAALKLFLFQVIQREDAPTEFIPLKKGILTTAGFEFLPYILEGMLPSVETSETDLGNG